MVDTNAFSVTDGWQAAGLLGALVYIANFLMVALDRMTSRNPLYYVLQMTGATLVMLSLVQQFNPAAAVIQTFFILVSLLGLCRHIKPRRMAVPVHSPEVQA